MKTTLEVPDALLRRVKIRAAERNQKLKDVIAQLLELGMSAEANRRAPPRPPKPVRLKRHGPVTIEGIESAIAGGRQ